MSISANFLSLKSHISENVTIVVVSKFQEKDNIMQVYDCGHRVFAENKVQEILRKKDILPPDIQWHMIGHLQRNKVKQISPFISMIHSVDSLKLLREINKQAEKDERVIDCLLQFFIASEETKFGLDMKEATQMIEDTTFSSFKHVRVCGVMGMASFEDNTNIVRNEFKELKNIFDNLKAKYFSDEASFNTISMGMTNDYNIAIEEGSTMLRIGSKIFQN
ncbi:MAG: YggS family pyridoxal phosphate-dependent enzyme [Bacteroidales bacterium]|nr:YggS family pyridoxal phosphate-dependent enzyme [Bacteroidales bacterium]